ARKCKSKTRGVRRYQDKGDKSSTANLRHHATRCFGEDAINMAVGGATGVSQNGNIFSSFAGKGQNPVVYSHRAHNTTDNRPATIVSDPELINLLTTGHPHLKVPSPNTVRRDVKAAYNKCRQRITTLLREHPGRVHFATDAWTSTNHHAFVAWTVHLEHNGVMLAFLLDILEV
ncbi:hypothetical protein BC826DRAFT_872328, partial [Russula brevipes]